MSKTVVDIVVPTFRLELVSLSSILSLEVPSELEANFIFVVDDPTGELPQPLLSAIESKPVKVLRNDENLGAHVSRNRGIEASTSDWILFLDDDIVPSPDLLVCYGEFIQSNPDALGAIGVTQFPPARSSFTRGIIASDILTFFLVATWMESVSWGVTSNILVNRRLLGEHRFSECFPKRGGGEDIDLFLRVVTEAGQNLCSLPGAVVQHPWWNDGKRSYRRFFRWAFGDSLLPKLHPQYRFFNSPNAVELGFLAFLALPLCAYAKAFWAWSIGVSGLGLGYFLGEWSKQMFSRGELSPVLAAEAAVIRSSNDLGRLMGNLSRGHLFGICERFDYFCDGKHIGSERLWGGLKFALCLLCASVGLLLFYFGPWVSK